MNSDTAGEEHRKCTRCIYSGPVSTFPMKKNLQRLLTCNQCTQKGAATRKTKRDQRAHKENASEPIRSNRRGPAPEQGAIMTMSWSEVIRLVKENSSKAFEVHVFAQLDDLVEEMREDRQEESGEQDTQDEGADATNALDGPDMITNEEIARRIARDLWEASGYRFIYKDCKTSDSAPGGKTYKFFCAQLKGQETKTRLVDDPEKRRARMSMNRFRCDGWLRITMAPGDPTLARIKIKHCNAHCKCVSLALSQGDRDMVRRMKNMPPSKIWNEVLRNNPDTEVTEKQIHREWMSVNRPYLLQYILSFFYIIGCFEKHYQKVRFTSLRHVSRIRVKSQLQEQHTCRLCPPLHRCPDFTAMPQEQNIASSSLLEAEWAELRL
ncbi:hypothetical protein EV421DRAFT_1439924 [Armillaria borealis]|uniref:Uncharacterized protein n=1 Tax=Armillaria borealis TaxID=47425 RepID=A0AA39IZI1_9AGAR|nr:hypothetical protein EV421DRAFT_1439924 [Armillaria borealis]